MHKLIVASAQQQMRLFDSAESYGKELGRFLRMAQAKGAQLVVFPALSGVMAAAPMLEGFRARLLRQADSQHRRQASLWERTRGALAGSTAGLLGASFRKAYGHLLEADPTGVASVYEATFSDLARSYEVTIVAGSAYLPDANAVIRHRATVFGPDGKVLGWHHKMTLAAEDQGLAAAGDTWTAVPTPVGKLGILLGEEVLYPEAGRVLAYQGAEIFVTLAAVTDEALAGYVRMATLARAQENQCFALTSFLVGKNHLASGDEGGSQFVGKSGIYAPLELTPRLSGVLVEMGTAGAEGLITAELNGESLRELWRSGVAPLRRAMPVDLFASHLPALYSSRQTLEAAWPDTENQDVPGAAGASVTVAPTGQPGDEALLQEEEEGTADTTQA